MDGTFWMPAGWTHNPCLQDRAPNTKRGAYLWLMDNASLVDGMCRYQGTHVLALKAGQLAISVNEMAGYWQWSERKVRKFLREFEKGELISVEDGPSNWVILTIKQYQSRGDPNPNHFHYPSFFEQTYSQPLRDKIRGHIPKRVRSAVFLKTDGLCFYCAAPLGEDFHIDHRKPVASGGTDNLANLVAACVSCNQRKGSLSEEKFRRQLEAGNA